MSKLRSIIRHEYLTIVRQPSFWIAMFAIPVILGVIFALVYLGNRSSAERIDEAVGDQAHHLVEQPSVVPDGRFLEEEPAGGDRDQQQRGRCGGAGTGRSRVGGPMRWAAPYGVDSAACNLALVASHHFARYGTTREALPGGPLGDDAQPAVAITATATRSRCR